MARTVIDLTATPVRLRSPLESRTILTRCAIQPTAKRSPPRPVGKRRFDKPTPEKKPVLDKGKGKAIVQAAPAEMTLVVKGLGTRGTFMVPASCSLAQVIGMVQERVCEIMGQDVQEVAGLMVQSGGVDEAMWEARPKEGRMSVALVWAWST